jgi:tripartite ATP-independent transporter DctM subunit
VLLFGAIFFTLGVAVEGTKFLQETVFRLPESLFGAGVELTVLYALAGCGLAMLALLVAAKPIRRAMLWKTIAALVPPLLLIFLVLGTIFIGIATPTEGGAMGATGALILAILNRRLSWSLMRQAMDTTAKLSSFVIFILIGAQTFSLFFNAAEGHHWVESLLANLPGGVVGFLIVVNILVFLLAFFLDFFELAFIIVPLLAPVAEKLGINLIWFGVVLGVNMQTSFMHPPFGFALFYLRSVAPDRPYPDKITGKITQGVTTMQIYWGAVPFVIIQCLMVGLVIAFPEMVTAGLDKGPKKDPSKIEIKIDVPTPDIQMPNIPPPTLPPKQ